MYRVIISLILFTTSLLALSVGESAKVVTLSGKDGGRVDGTPWSSKMIKNKVYLIFYVDPDEKDTNNALSQALKKEKFDHEKYGSIAIVNLAATWLPNFAIEAKLKAKQKEYPSAIYVKDKTKKLVHEWGLKDDSSDILLFDKKGILIYKYEGKLNNEEIKKVLTLIREQIK